MSKTILLTMLLLPAASFAQTATQPRRDAAAAKTGTDPERVICRATPDTGSLVRKTRRCMTAAQWTATINAHNTVARDMVRDNSGLLSGQ